MSFHYFQFQPSEDKTLEVVDRGSETQLRVGEFCVYHTDTNIG